MTSELGNTLQRLWEEIDSPGLTMERAEKLLIEITQVRLQVEDDQRICSVLDDMTARLLAWTDVNGCDEQLQGAAE